MCSTKIMENCEVSRHQNECKLAFHLGFTPFQATRSSFTVKNFFLLCNLNLPYFCLDPFSPCPIITCPCKQSLSSFLANPLQVLKSCNNKLTPEPSLLQAKQSQSSQPFCIKFCGHLMPPMASFVELLVNCSFSLVQIKCMCKINWLFEPINWGWFSSFWKQMLI